MTIPERLFGRMVARSRPEGDCIVTTYSTGSHGYGQVGWRDGHKTRMTLTHRAMWELLRGPIPASLTVDHVCRNRRCHNLAHLRLLTNVENATDNGMARRTHCPKGHAYDDDNTYRNSRGHRFCRLCARLRRTP